jgi:hypothetical protein
MTSFPKTTRYVTVTIHAQHKKLNYINPDKQIKIDENTRLCSFDTENMYTIVPITNVKHKINEILSSNNINEIVKEEI